MTQQARQTPWLIAAMVLGALAANKNPNAGSAAMAGGQALAAQSQLNFSRDMEREADRIGFNVMTDAGFDSRGVASMFERLQQASRLNDNGSFPYLRSHPLTTERIAAAQSRVQLDIQSEPAATRATQLASAKTRSFHGMMAARARVLGDPGVEALRSMLAEARRPGLMAETYDVRTAGTLYAGAFAAARMRDFASARSFTEKLKTMAADNPPALKAAELLALEIEVMAGAVSPDAGQIDLNKAASRAELLIESRALMLTGRTKEVSERLLTWVIAHPRDSAAWQLLSAAYASQNQAVRSIRAEAEARVAQLDYSGGLDRMKAAQAMMRANPASSDFMEGSIIDARTRELESLIKQNALQEKVDR